MKLSLAAKVLPALIWQEASLPLRILYVESGAFHDAPDTRDWQSESSAESPHQRFAVAVGRSGEAKRDIYYGGKVEIFSQEDALP